MKQALLKITGRVQGVFYRANALKEAQKLGLSGHARNLLDGSVEVLLQGDESAIHDFIEWAREGSPSAQVSEVEVEWQELKNMETEFRIF